MEQDDEGPVTPARVERIELDLALANPEGFDGIFMAGHRESGIANIWLHSYVCCSL
jgi:hypothetical protein